MHLTPLVGRVSCGVARAIAIFIHLLRQLRHVIICAATKSYCINTRTTIVYEMEKIGTPFDLSYGSLLIAA